ncbi:putative short-chain oxidoreductase [Xylariomycetidae sp. FL0641]|nr:putative short-chain oxidoreductase [Xylariomycetidae sp. FL0641]
MSSSPTPLTWLITGCSSGFGTALARHAQSRGHRIIATSRDPTSTPSLVREITSATSSPWHALDVTSASAGAALVSALAAQGIAIDVLVNSAGTATVGPVESFSETEARDVFEVDVFGPYRLMRAVLPSMRARRRGVVVNLSTGSALEARPALGVYGAAKAALDGLTKTLHREMWDFGVRVLLVQLGAFDTPMMYNTRRVVGPVPEDYDGTVTRAVVDLKPQDFKPGGDHRKAVRAIYEVVVGEGVGVGREDEMVLPLGADMGARVHQVQGKMAHMMEVFGEVCYGVGIEAGGKSG